jgi:hypothetical protein
MFKLIRTRFIKLARLVLSMDQAWKKFDIINDAHAFLTKTIAKIEKKKTQRLVGKKPSQYIVECSKCCKPTMIAFTGINFKKNEFVCFECLAKE